MRVDLKTFCVLASVVPLMLHAPTVDAGVPASRPSAPASDVRLTLAHGDVVAMLGGEWVVQELETAHLESLLAAASPGRGVRFRNMGWEGDTVFEQPRDVNFPPVREQFRRAGATVIFAQFGQSESLAGAEGLPAFVAAYEKLCDELARQTPRLVLVTPPPLGRSADPLMPDAAARNRDLVLYADAVRELAKRRGYACVNLFRAAADGPLTDDQWRPTPRGAALVALAAARELGLAAVADRAGKPGPDGRWASPEMEALRQAAVAKNKLWFNYWRPMNWAFLGGDRMTVPSSKDHRDPSIRWFPAEMEQYVPLIESAESRMDNLAQAAAAKGEK